MYIHLKSKDIFGMAGLWEIWKSPEGEDIRSCTIITTDSTGWMKKIHHRMPVIIPGELRDSWLDPAETTPGNLLPMLQPYDPELLAAHEVSAAVNSVSNNSPENLLKLE